MENFKDFTNHLYDIMFEETSEYLSNFIGKNDWGEELHEAHGVIMYNVIEALAEKVGVIKK